MKNIRTFFFSFIAALLVVFAAFVIVVNYCGKGVCEQGWFLHLYPLKNHYAAEKQGPKIVLIGGSSSLFGINGEKLRAYTGMDNINFSMSILIPMRFYMTELEKYVGEGDVVVLPLELGQHYNETSEKNFSNFGISLLFGCHNDAQKTLSFTELCQLYFQYGFSWINSSLFDEKGPIMRASSCKPEQMGIFDGYYKEDYIYQLSMQCRSMKKPGDGPNHLADLSEYGDWLIYTKASEYDGPVCDVPQVLTDEFISNYRKIKALTEERGAKLLLVWPNMFFYAEQAGLAEFKELLNSNGIEICGRPEAMAYPKFFYHDPICHMNASGAELWTYELAKIICKETGRKMNERKAWPYVVFADDPAKYFPGAENVSVCDTGVSLEGSEVKMSVDVPEDLRGKMLELDLIVKPPVRQDTVFSEILANGTVCENEQIMNRERAEIVITVPGTCTKGEKLELLYRINGSGMTMERLFIRMHPYGDYPTDNVIYANRHCDKLIFFNSGFSSMEEWGIWTDGEKSEFSIYVPKELKGKATRLVFDACTYISPNRPFCGFSISAGGRVLRDFQFDKFDNKFAVSIPAELMNDKKLTLTINVDSPVSPKENGESIDERELGVGIRSIRFAPDVSTGISAGKRDFSSGVRLPSGKVVYSNRDGNRFIIFGSGFTFPEEWGAWTDGEEASFSVYVPRECRGRDAELVIRAYTYVDKAKKLCDFSLSANGRVLKNFRSENFDGEFTVKVPAEFTKGPRLPLTINIDSPISPKDRGTSDDTRRLGVGIKSVSFTVDGK